MRKFTGILVKRFWGLCAFTLIALAVLVALGRELAPELGRYRADIEQRLSDAMGVQVSIGSISASWDGLTPELQLEQVQVTSARGEPIIRLARGAAEVDLLRSLVNLQLTLKRLSLVDAHMGFRQNAEGFWTVPGVEPLGGEQDAFDIDDPLDIFLLADRIEFQRASFSFDFRSGHSSRLELPQLTVQNQGRLHRLHSEVTVDHSGDQLSLIIEAEGDPRNPEAFSARGYLSLQRFELDKAVAALPLPWWDGLPEQQWRKGHQLDLEAWFDVQPGARISSRGWFDIGDLPVSLEQSVALPQRTSSRFAAEWDRSGAWKLALRDLALQWQGADAPLTNLLLSSAGLGEAVHLQTAALDLQAWSEVLRSSRVLSGKGGEILDNLQPSGTLRNVHLTIAGTRPEDISLRANLDQVGVAAWAGAPELKKVDGYLQGSPFDGLVEVASEQGFSMFYPTIYREPLEFSRARGQVRWRIDPDAGTVNIHSGLLSVSSDSGEGRGYFSLFIPLDFGSVPEELIVQVGLRDSAARFHKRFTPSVLPDPLLEWLDASVTGGDMSEGGFIYRGGFTRETVQHASTQLFLNVDHASLDYHPDWPALREAKGVVWLDDRRVNAQLESGRLLDTQLTEGSLEIEVDDSGRLLLDIAGQARGDAGEGLRLVRESPLRELGGEIVADWSASGPMQVDIDMRVPLSAEQQLLIRRLALQVDDAQLSLANEQVSFDSLSGRIAWSPKQGLRAEELKGMLWGEPLQADILPDETSTQETKGERFLLTLQGKMPAARLQQWLPAAAAQFVDGSADFEASLPLAFGPGGIGAGPQLHISSSLVGMALALPEPFGKSAGEARRLRASLSLNEARQLQLHYEDVLHGIVDLQGERFSGAAFAINDVAGAPAADTMTLSGRFEQLSLADWQPVVERYLANSSGGGGEASPAFKYQVDLSLGSLVLGGLDISELHLQGQQNAGRWELQLASDMLAGEAHFSPDPALPIVLDLEHLRLPRAGAPADAADLDTSAAIDILADLDPRGLPPVDFAVRQFSVGGEDYGSWSFQLRPTAQGVVARQIIGSVRGGQIVGMTPGEGAELYWERQEGENRSRFNGRFVTANLGSVLKQWNQPHLLDSESSIFDARLSWAGSPAAVSLTALQGSMVMNIKRGTFIRGAGEASTGSALLQLIAFFNFDTWMRRLQLDFSDLSRGGTSFETIEGALTFDQGKVHMNTPVVVNSTSSRFQMAGVVDLVRSELDTKLVATLPVGGNLTFVAALAGMGLPGVAGMWLISKVFEEQIGKMSSFSFNVTGPLDDPDMDFVRLFDDQVVQEEARR